MKKYYVFHRNDGTDILLQSTYANSALEAKFYVAKSWQILPEKLFVMGARAYSNKYEH